MINILIGYLIISACLAAIEAYTANLDHKLDKGIYINCVVIFIFWPVFVFMVFGLWIIEFKKRFR